jgi:maltose O-acetyltransferase
VVIHTPERVSIGARCAIAEFVHMWGGGGITIGNDVMIASHAVITSLTHDTRAAVYRESLIRKPVVIEDNVWIGAGAVILPGVSIGSGSVVGAGSVVTRDVPAGTVVVGVPARAIRSV